MVSVATSFYQRSANHVFFIFAKLILPYRGWIEELSDPRLSAKLRELPEADLELLTLLCVGGCSQTQAAHVLGCTQQAVSKRLRKIKKYLA